MDNVTHLLVGMLVAEASICIRRPAHDPSAGPQGFRKALYLGSLLGNNMPDFDFLYAWGSRPLGYLLHHRGHTHTLPVALLLGVLSFFIVRGVARLRKWQLDANDKKWILAVSLLGTLIHIGLDSANNYGVHPFWPFYNGWFYGDSFFIIEPLFWAALIAPLIWNIERSSLRILLGAVLLIGVGLCWFGGYVPRSMALVVTLLSLMFFLAARRLQRSRRALFAAGAFVTFAVLLIAASSLAKRRIYAESHVKFPSATTHDLVLTPLPANPFCWTALLIQTEAQRLLVRKGSVSVAPSLFAADECRFGADHDGTARGKLLEHSAQAAVHWSRQYEMERKKLISLAHEHCRVRAFLQFSRAPFLGNHPTKGEVMVDMRYDREPDIEFAEFPLQGDASCPALVPPWLAPRADILSE